MHTEASLLRKTHYKDKLEPYAWGRSQDKIHK